MICGGLMLRKEGGPSARHPVQTWRSSNRSVQLITSGLQHHEVPRCMSPRLASQGNTWSRGTRHAQLIVMQLPAQQQFQLHDRRFVSDGYHAVCPLEFRVFPHGYPILSSVTGLLNLNANWTRSKKRDHAEFCDNFTQ